MEENQRLNFKNILLLSLLGNVLFASIASYTLWQLNYLDLQINTLTDSYNELSKSFSNTDQQLNLTRVQLEYYREQAEYYSSLVNSDNASEGIVGHATVNIVAVRSVQKGFQVEYQGIVMTADVELREGEGRILVNTVPRIGIDIQTSVRTGVRVAENLTGISFGKTDIILTIRASLDTEVVDGPSAGAAITVAIIAAVRRQDLNQTVYMTGTINSDGTLGPVGGVPQKALAAAESGSKTFLVPKGQKMITIYVPKITHPKPGWTVIIYEQQVLDLQEYLIENGYSILVLEVERIEEAYEVYIMN